MAGGISIHAVDVAEGRPAQGLRVEIWRIAPDRTLVAEGVLAANGQLPHGIEKGEGVVAGEYEALFHLGAFYAARGKSDSFLTVAPFRFALRRVEEHFHLPMKFTPWGYSLFRGA